MAKSDHPWCRDVSRDEAVRRAEDDAAQWRRLEVGEVIEEGDEFLSVMDGWRRTAMTGNPAGGSIAYRRRRVPPIQHRDLPAAVEALTERVARLEAVTPPREAAPVSRDGVNADGLRTERITLEVTHDCAYPASEWVLEVVQDACTDPGESVRVVEEALEIDRLTAERDAAIRARDEARMSYLSSRLAGDRYAQAVAEADAARAECERLRRELRTESDHCTRLVAERDASLDDADALRASVAEVESERDAARAECERLRAQNALLWEAIGLATTSVPSLAIDADDPVGMMRRVVARKAELEGAKAANATAGGEKPEPVAWVATKAGDDGGYQRCLGWDRNMVIHGIDLTASSHPVSVSPLYAAPPEPRGWLTAEERDAVDHAADIIEDMEDDDGNSLKPKADVLRALRDRSTPPRWWLRISGEDCAALYLARAVLDGVFVGTWQEKHDAARRLVSIRERAIREAGGEVENE